MHENPKTIRVLASLVAIALFLSACNFPNLLSFQSAPKPEPTSTIGSSSLVSPEAPAASEAPAATEAPTSGVPATEIVASQVAPTESVTANQTPEATRAVVYPTYTASEQPPQAPAQGMVYPTYPAPTEKPAQPAPAQPPAGQPKTVKIFLIGMGDNGKSGKPVGCGDSAIAATVQIPATKRLLWTAMEQLLSVHDQYYGQSGLYNALYQSNLRVQNIRLVNGHAEIWLTGSIKIGGECDDPRVKAQLAETALQFPTVKSVTIYINNRNINDIFSLRG